MARVSKANEQEMQVTTEVGGKSTQWVGERAKGTTYLEGLKNNHRSSAMPDSQGVKSEDNEPQGAQTKQPRRHARGEGFLRMDQTPLTGVI